MKEPIEIKGVWWLPDNPENELSGILTFSQDDGGSLDIVGVFGTETSERVMKPTIILGVSQNGKPITLYECFYTNMMLPWGGVGGAKYRTQVVFEGAHFESKEDIKFNQLYGNYTDLDVWVGISGFTINADLKQGKFISEIKYEKPAASFIDIDDDLEVGLDFSAQGPHLSIVQVDATISQRVYLVVKSKSGDVSFENLFTQLNKFSYLLQAAAQRAVYPVSVFGFSRKNPQERIGGEPDYPKINIYYQPIEASEKVKFLNCLKKCFMYITI